VRQIVEAYDKHSKKRKLAEAKKKSEATNAPANEINQATVNH
jgi:hypothetical protein